MRAPECARAGMHGECECRGGIGAKGNEVAARQRAQVKAQLVQASGKLQLQRLWFL